ncbi:class I SAM-dependent methyltransferase [Vibrio sp. WXL103]|uniref:class I SAM-dependent methyltransferase n=1 Tax=Vibrio sp. WXL103 TaxID=3450710 RepID=UPI003EC9491C
MNELKTKASTSLSDSVKHNERAWDHYVEQGVSWTQAVDADAIVRAKQGNFEVHLGLKRPIEREWFPSDMRGLKVLCLAGGGGQQGPLLAAMGANVTVMDLSAGQLAADIKSAELNGLSIQTEQGDMRDLSRFSSELFDIILCPVSITYIPDLTTLYQECFRVLKSEGCFMLAAPHPAIYLFDADLWDQGIYQVRNRLPFNSMDELNEDEQRQFIADKKAIEFSHTMEQIVGGQLKAGFVIDRFVEDQLDEGLSQYMSDYFATRARKLAVG